DRRIETEAIRKQAVQHTSVVAWLDTHEANVVIAAVEVCAFNGAPLQRDVLGFIRIDSFIDAKGGRHMIEHHSIALINLNRVELILVAVVIFRANTQMANNNVAHPGHIKPPFDGNTRTGGGLSRDGYIAVFHPQNTAVLATLAGYANSAAHIKHNNPAAGLA